MKQIITILNLRIRQQIMMISFLLLGSFYGLSQDYLNKFLPRGDNFEVFAVYSSAEVNDGYLFAADMWNEEGFRTAVLVKCDFYGDTVWTKRMSTHPNVTAAKLVFVINNEIFFLHSFAEDIDSNRNFMLVKLTLEGEVIWSEQYGDSESETPNWMSPTDDGGFIICGSSNSFSGSLRFYAVKVDQDGQLEWEQTYGGNWVDVCNSIIQTSDGGYLMSGYSNSFSSDYNFLVIKTNAQGEVIWQNLLGVPDVMNGGGGVQELSDGTYLANTAYRNSSNVTISRILKIDFDGNIIWQKQFPYGSYSHFNTHLIELWDGTIVVGGIGQNAGNNSIFIFNKLNPYGNIIWQHEYFTRTDIPQYIYDVSLTSDEGFLLSGLAFPADTVLQHAWIVKTDCFGCDSLVCFYEDTVCNYYDCTEYPITAYFSASDPLIDPEIGTSITFLNESANTTSRHWDFGDGTVAYTDNEFTHVYPEAGTYTVTLTVHHGPCSQTWQQDVAITETLGLNNIVEGEISLFPNPANEFIRLHAKSNLHGTLSVTTADGRLVHHTMLQGEMEVSIPTESFENGIYFMTLVDETNNQSQQFKFVVQH